MSKLGIPNALGRGETQYKLDPRPPSQGGTVVVIGIDTDDGPEHILWSNSARNMRPDRPMIDTIKRYGIQQAIKVRRNGDTQEVIFGRKRRLNLLIANEELVAEGKDPWPLPAVKFDGSDEELAELILIENLHREEEGVVETARGAARLLRLGKSKAYVAGLCKFKSVHALEKLLQVLDLDPKAQAAIEQRTGGITRFAVTELVDLKFDEQNEVLDEVLAEAEQGIRPTVERVREKVAAKRGKEHIGKLKTKQIRNLIGVLQADSERKRSERHFEIEDPHQFAADLLRVMLLELKPNRIKGMVAALEGRVALPDEA